jgi:hypothetical protein
MQPLQIRFRVSLNDWLEFRRREQPAFRLWLLHLADLSWLPLLFLLAVSVLLVSLTFLSAVNVSFPAWLPIPILGLLALSRVYLSVPSIEATRSATREWKEKMASLNRIVDLTETGFQYIAGPSTYQPTWLEVGSMSQSKNLLIFCDDDDEYALLIPKRAFGSEKQLQQFVDIAYQKTVIERSPDGSKSAERALGAESPVSGF